MPARFPLISPLRLGVLAVLGTVCPMVATGQTISTSINATDTVFKSTGGTAGTDYNLWSDGYLGTFIKLDQPGQVQITVNAAGQEAQSIWPTMGLHIGNQQVNWTVGDGSFNDYTATVDLPAGTFSVRTEFLNDFYDQAQNQDRNLLLRDVTFEAPSVTNLSIQNPTDTGALHQTIFDASDSYIENYRKGDAQVQFLDAGGNPLAAGAQVQVNLRRHQFNFGTAVAGASQWGSTEILPNPTPGSNADYYQQALRQNFNATVPENAGKWGLNEETRGVVTMEYVDQIASFAQANDMRARYHGVIWGAQQPQWAIDLENAALAGDTAAADDLRQAISDRIAYSVGDRANSYIHIDGINESYHQSVFLEIYGMDGLADIYNEMIDTKQATGSAAKVYFNEYGALQSWSDAYGNWYRDHIQDAIDAGITPDNVQDLAVGLQYYANPGSHDIARFYRGLQTLGTLGLPMTLTEFGVDDVNTAEAPQIMFDAMRMVFGTDQTDGFMAWGFWANAMWLSGAALYDENWNLTDTGKVWQQLMGIQDWGLSDVPIWSTDLTLLTDSEGQIDFRGFFGDYDLLVDGVPVQFTLAPDGTIYTVQLPEPGSLSILACAAGLLLLRPRRSMR